MADYYVGQGKLSIATRNSSGLTSGFEWLGDADAFSITHDESFLDFYESYSGKRARVVHISQGKDVGFSMSLRHLTAKNLAKAVQGTITAGTGATVTAEAHTAYNGQMTFLKYPGVSSVVINKGGTPLVLGTDYTLDAVNGTFTILPGSTAVPVGAGSAVTANYTYASYGGTIEALTATSQEYALRFDGFSQTDGSPLIVNLHRVTLDIAAELALIGEDVAALEMTGGILPATEITTPGLSQYYTVVRAA